MRKLLALPVAKTDLIYWAQTNPKKYQKIKTIVAQLLVNPRMAMGKPEPLKHNQAGLWSCRIDQENRLVYSFDEESLYLWRARYHYLGIPNSSTIEQAIELKDDSV
jgi:toxin YoeB